MIIYGSSISPFVRKVLVALNEKGIRYEHRPVAPQAEDADFRAASPMGKIPAIDHDGFRLADSSAISSARSSSIESSPSCSRSGS
jgi:glutathione S-transferase